MEIYTMTLTRPSMPLPRACAPSALSLVPASAPVASVPVERWAPVSAPASAPALLVGERAQVSREHQAQVQAELAGALLLIDGINGTTGFKGNVSAKRYTDGGSGVPPRGRPV